MSSHCPKAQQWDRLGKHACEAVTGARSSSNLGAYIWPLYWLPLLKQAVEEAGLKWKMLITTATTLRALQAGSSSIPQPQYPERLDQAPTYPGACLC